MNNARDIYITSAQGKSLTEQMAKVSPDIKLGEFLTALAKTNERSLKLGRCYIRCNTKHDPPLGDMILRVEFEGLDADIESFCKDLLHLITSTDVTGG
jgi:hypothetical protein